MITGTGPTWCQVDDMARSIAFYRDGLGLTLVRESAWWSEFKVGELTIALHPRLTPGEGPLGQNERGWYLGLSSDDLPALRVSAVAHGGTDHGYHDVPSGVVLTVCDPDGNPVQIVQYGAKIADLG